ncbi:MAG: aminodeoxychorismate/anthranilate synthase component II [Ferruginibacter sp.]|nr:aminodeoxychorismate/anthranilate synthase component II [Ferruginibacter sp.]
MAKVLVLDNYDSFTFNLVHQAEAILQDKVNVYKNDEIDIDAIAQFDKILLSPGPGLPSEAGIMMKLISVFGSKKSILGVCLGCQAIAEVYGGTLYNPDIFHGVSMPVWYKETEPLYRGMTNPFIAGRYHSWVINSENFPDSLKITAYDEKGLIMGVSHRIFDVKGVQFHPESIMTPEGRQILLNWLTE